MNDIEMTYTIKCKKYKAEDLTDELKFKLLEEAVHEVTTMDYVNSCGLNASL